MTSENKDRKIRRKTAEGYIQGLLERIAIVNGNPDFCYSVDEVYLFGSFINSDKDMISDLDVAMRITPNYDYASYEFESKRQEYTGRNFLMAYDWPKQEVLKFIRNRNAYLSIHIIGDPEQDGIIFADKTLRIYPTNDESTK